MNCPLRRMRRRLANLTAVLGLAASLALLGLWLRSRSHVDTVSAERFFRYIATSSDGSICLAVHRDLLGLAGGPATPVAASDRWQFRRSSDPLSPPTAFFLVLGGGDGSDVFAGATDVSTGT